MMTRHGAAFPVDDKGAYPAGVNFQSGNIAVARVNAPGAALDRIIAGKAEWDVMNHPIGPRVNKRNVFANDQANTVTAPRRDPRCLRPGRAVRRLVRVQQDRARSHRIRRPWRGTGAEVHAPQSGLPCRATHQRQDHPGLGTQLSRSRDLHRVERVARRGLRGAHPRVRRPQVRS